MEDGVHLSGGGGANHRWCCQPAHAWLPGDPVGSSSLTAEKGFSELWFLWSWMLQLWTLGVTGGPLRACRLHPSFAPFLCLMLWGSRNRTRAAMLWPHPFWAFLGLAALRRGKRFYVPNPYPPPKGQSKRQPSRRCRRWSVKPVSGFLFSHQLCHFGQICLTSASAFPPL